MREPPMFQRPDTHKKGKWWWRLKQAVYRLPQAGQLWFQEIHGFLVEIGFKQNRADPYVYYLREGKDFMIISLTVDDILNCCTSPEMRTGIIHKLTEKFKYIDEGPCDSFLGMKVTQDHEEIRLSQEHFINGVEYRGDSRGSI
jgi:Reverse transcriptase (RNA-dependent DNA polymerase)